MRDRIFENLKSIERQYEVKIILAVESGSRSWGIPSESSDYDVRFVYIHKTEWYLSIDEQRDVIEIPIDEHLDMHGWELRKALRLLRKANPHLLEWLHSGIVYYQDDLCMENIRAIAEAAFSSKAALFHYVHMAKRNHLEFLQKDRVQIKKYFYVLWPILACLWIEKYNLFPPLDFRNLVDKTLVSNNLKEDVLSLIQQKQVGVDTVLASHFEDLHHFIETEIEWIVRYAKTLEDEHRNIKPQLDLVFRQTLASVWGKDSTEE